MQIKNILFAAFFVATSQLSCVDEQTDIKAKLQAELGAKCEAMDKTLSDLSKKVIEQEIIHNIAMKELDEKFDQYVAWQISMITKDDTDTKNIEQKINTIRGGCRQEYNHFAQIIAKALDQNIKIENLLFNEKYKISNEINHALLRLYYVRSFIETIKLNILINQCDPDTI